MKKATQRVTVLLSTEELREIEDAWHEDRRRSRNDAIRDLIQRGLAARRAERAAQQDKD